MTKKTLIAFYNLATACYKEGDLDRAVELFERFLHNCDQGIHVGQAGAAAEQLGAVLLQGGAKFAAKLAALEQKYPGVQI